MVLVTAQTLVWQRLYIELKLPELIASIQGRSRLRQADFALWVLRQCPVPYCSCNTQKTALPMDQLNQLTHQILDSQRRLETLILNLDYQAYLDDCPSFL